MSDNIVSIFDRFSLTKTEGQPAKSSSTVRTDYRAATTERPGKRAWSIRIYYSNGEVEQINYSYRKYDLSVSPDRLGISFTTGVVMLTGKNLRLLLDDLQDERIRSIQPFDPAIHKTPKEGEPVIELIEWKALSEIRQHSNLVTQASEGN